MSNTVNEIGGPAFDWKQTIFSQYSNSEVILEYIDFLTQNLDATGSVNDFYDQVWNIDTAQGWGLDFWGKIVGLENGRTLFVQNQYFGFKEAADPNQVGFNQAPFYSGASTTSNYELNDDAFRQLIYAKAYANISGCSIQDINSILTIIFGASGVCYCTDGQDMTMTYTFLFLLTPIQISIIETSGVLPKPTGVSFTIIQGMNRITQLSGGLIQSLPDIHGNSYNILIG